jgi:hypothetical protein
MVASSCFVFTMCSSALLFRIRMAFPPSIFFFGECAGWGVASHPVVWCSRCGRLLVRCVGLYASALSHFRSCSRFCGLSLVVDGLPVRFLVLDERSLRRFVGQVLSTWSYR